MRDMLLDKGAQTAEGTSVVDMVRVVPLERDKALQKARATLAEVQIAAAERETALAASASSAPARPRHPQGGMILADPGQGESQGGRVAGG
jgi:hypothetical protein